MAILALETSGAVGSVALAEGRRVLARSFLMDARQHASHIMGAVESTLHQARARADDVRELVAGAGPGSFTGVRIAAATAKGLAHALGAPLWAFSSLAAGAVSDRVLPEGAGPDAWPWRGRSASHLLRWVVFDARGERVYAALYRSEGGRLWELEAPRAARIGELLDAPLAAEAAFAGDGALRHRDRIEQAGFTVLEPPAGVPTADSLVHLLATSGEAPLQDPGSWEPDYLRASNAERERDR
jgi:tRNA threonylcarbamoyladenosine biosynthesis protein TsaB